MKLIHQDTELILEYINHLGLNARFSVDEAEKYLERTGVKSKNVGMSFRKRANKVLGFLVSEKVLDLCFDDVLDGFLPTSNVAGAVFPTSGDTLMPNFNAVCYYRVFMLSLAPKFDTCRVEQRLG